MRVVLDLLEGAERAQVRDHALGGLLDLEPGVRAAGLGDAAVLADGLDGLEAVGAADVEVGEVVRRRDLEGAGAEGGVDALVGHDLELAPEQRQDGRLADDVLVPLVVGVHGHGRVAEHRLRPRRGDGDAAAAGHVVADVVERAGHVPVRHLEVADRRAAARAPVHEVAVLVDVALLVEGDEDLGHGADVALVEGEALALEVAGAADALELLDDGAAVLPAPLPHAAHELLAPQVLLGEALRAQHLLDHVLRGDAGVVGADQPAGVLAEHAVVAREHVLDGVVERVAHVQHAGDVGRRDDDGVRRPLGVGLGVEEVLVEPVLHPARLDGGRLEARGLLQVVVHQASLVAGGSSIPNAGGAAGRAEGRSLEEGAALAGLDW